MIALNFPTAPLLFNEGSHSYFCKGNKLKSVTTLLHETLFANKYEDVDEEVLERAAKFGKDIHAHLEDMFKKRLGLPTEDNLPELDELQHSVFGKAVALLDGSSVIGLMPEYLVTDESLAGSIDLVADVNGESAIVDYKFTYNLDVDYLSWQESIYAYLFEKMTGQHIDKLYAVWVPKRDITLGKFVEIARKTNEQIEDLASGKITTLEDAVPAVIQDLTMAIASVLEAEKRASEQKKELQERLLKLMEENGVKSLKNEYFEATYVAPIKKSALDAKALVAAHPEIDTTPFMKESTTKSSIRLKLK